MSKKIKLITSGQPIGANDMGQQDTGPSSEPESAKQMSYFLASGMQATWHRWLKGR
jgi:hypothetical protein